MALSTLAAARDDPPEAARDPRFAEKLRQAKGNAELGLSRIFARPRTKSILASAAWALERMFPEKYARRGPEVITSEQLAQVLEQLMERSCGTCRSASIARTSS